MTELSINPSDIAAALRKNLEGFSPDVSVSQVGRILEVGDGIARVAGLPDAAVNELLQFEDGTVGLAGGILGLGLAQLGLWGIRQQPTGFSDILQLDASMLLTTFVIAIAASVLAGLLPAWHACQVTPAVQLKSQ